MSRRVLILAERGATGITDSSYELLEAASRLAGSSEEVSAVLPVGDASDAEALTGAFPAGELLLVEGPALAAPTADGTAAAVLHAREASGAECILLPHNPVGWDVAPLVAAQLGTAAATAVSALSWSEDGLVAKRSAFLGKFVQEVLAPGLPAVATVERGAFPAREAGPASSVRILPSPVGPDELRSRLVEVRDAGGGGVDLTAAEVVVAAGRGLGGPENLEIVRELAAALGGVVGASRAVTDAGWLPHELQIGSSGATVSPKLYVACAISGAIQHLVGMRGSRFVVAINKDPDAPIFGAADVGIVGDALEVIPALTEALRNLDRTRG